MEEMHRARYRSKEGTELPHSFQVHHPPSTSTCSPTWKLLNLLNLWPLVLELNLQSLSPSQRLEVGLKFYSSSHMVGSSGDQPPS